MLEETEWCAVLLPEDWTKISFIFQITLEKQTETMKQVKSAQSKLQRSTLTTQESWELRNLQHLRTDYIT